MRKFRFTSPSRWLTLSILAAFLMLTPSGVKAQGGGGTATAPYMRDAGPMKIFDESLGAEQSPLERIAERVSKEEKRRERLSLDRFKNLVTYDITLEGAKEEQIVQQARIEALKAAVGRLYFENYLLLGLDLLEPYLRQNGEPFVVRTNIDRKEYIEAGRLRLHLIVSVNLNDLYADLREKRFIAEPNLRPIVAAHLAEIIDGKSDLTAGGRPKVEGVFQENLFRVHSDLMREPPLSTDLTTSPGLLATARLEAQRNDVDVLVTGRLEFKTTREQPILYDRYSFQGAQLNLKLYRVDNGELILERSDSYNAVAPTDVEARQKVLDTLAGRVAQELAEKLRDLWKNTVLMDENFRLQISLVEPDELESIYNLLKTFSPDIKIYRKSYYGKVLVLNLIVPEAIRGNLESMLKDARQPQFDVRKVDDRRFELEML